MKLSIPWAILFTPLFSPVLFAQDQTQVEFFEKKIRPAFLEHCGKCHGMDGKKPKGGFSIATSEALRKGGDTGPAIIPGKPEQSLLIKALRYDGELVMPPKGKLPDAVVADFSTWIKNGAIDPRQEKTTQNQKAKIQGKDWWAFKPLQKVVPPNVTSPAILNDIDRFIVSRLQKENFSLSPLAEKEVFIRRIYFDLIGLPPTPEQIKAFLNDTSNNAYEKLVDQLLRSPHFGERWGRHWLDVVRFSESSGGGRTLLFPDAWRYRDYVIRSFNEDKPINRFIIEQIAGDLLQSGSPTELENNLVATTFLALGPTNYERQDKKILEMDVIDEQLDTLGKAFLGMTIGCARCHDHKFDPIPTQDYYALAGIFKSTKTLIHENVSRWVDRELPVDKEAGEKIAEHKKLVAELENQIKGLKGQNKSTSKAILPLEDLPQLGGIILDDSLAKKVGDWKDSRFNGTFIGTGYIHDDNKDKGEKTVTFNPEFTKGGKYEVLLAYASGNGRADNVPVTIFHADGESVVSINMKKPPEVEGRFVSLGQFRFEAAGQGFVMVSNQDAKGHVTVDAAWFLPLDANGKAVRNEKPVGKNGGGQDLKKLEDELKALKSKAPNRPVAMSIEEEKKPTDIHICIRGNVHTPGALAKRGYLTALNAENPPPIPSNASGRKEVGLWLTEGANPLTSRIFVNRVWHWIFGSGLVRTTDNFGVTGELPSHPELLDYLAARFLREGWSAKKLIREIVLSATYRQSTLANPEALRKDPDNRLLSHMNRRRLEAEQLRDALLQTSGQLDLTMGGPNIKAGTNSEYGYKFTDLRRSVYIPVFRNTLPELFEVFDFPDPNLVVGKRNSSTVAPQALFLMNNPQIMEYSRHAARNLLSNPGIQENQRVRLAFLVALGREPTPQESADTHRFIESFPAKEKETAWAKTFQAIFSTLDFRYLH